MPTQSATAITIVHEHADFVVVNKPCGIAMHERHNGIASLMQQQHPEHKWHLVHRLDTGTSGCLILAKHKAAAAALGDLFARRKIEKYYFALSDKKPKKKQGLVKGDMQAARRGDRKLVNTTENPAITQYFSASVGPSLRLFICRPLTGKTHQIRVALKSQGAPILGDGRYGNTLASRMYLFSYALRFEYQSKPIEIVCLDASQDLFDWQSLPSTWLAPWQLPWPKL